MDNAIVAGDIVEEAPLGHLPLLHVVRAARNKHTRKAGRVAEGARESE